MEKSTSRSLLNTPNWMRDARTWALLLVLAVSGTATSVPPSHASTGADLEAKAQAVSAARHVMEDFMIAFNSRDEVAWAETFNYPHIRFASGQVRTSEDKESVLREMDFERFAAATGWHHSAWDSIELVHAGATKVHFSVSFTRYNEAGDKLKTYQSLYIVTLKDGHWGIQSRSSFAP